MTISLDRVILVREIKSGDLIHIDACINRAWGSSLGSFIHQPLLGHVPDLSTEAGVRVLLEDMDTGELIYCCHGASHFVQFELYLIDICFQLI